jgi:rhodanese-related sulfurtransferase
LNVSREEFAADYAIQKALLESDKGRLIAVYCEGLDCEDSQMVAGALVKLGYRRVLLFKGGWTEWTFQHLPREAQH